MISNTIKYVLHSFSVASFSSLMVIVCSMVIEKLPSHTYTHTHTHTIYIYIYIYTLYIYIGLLCFFYFAFQYFGLYISGSEPWGVYCQGPKDKNFDELSSFSDISRLERKENRAIITTKFYKTYVRKNILPNPCS